MVRGNVNLVSNARENSNQAQGFVQMVLATTSTRLDRKVRSDRSGRVLDRGEFRDQP
jgi:hypothetical protein